LEGLRVTAFMQPDTAVIVRQRLLENAQDVDALFVLAALNARDGLVAEGITVLDHVLMLDPAYPGAWRFKATLHRMRGENEAGQSAWDRAEDLEP
jgi:Tfp pilus assembly protein PilF